MYAQIRALLAQFSGRDQVVVVPVALIKLVGSLDGAALLNQLLFRCSRALDLSGDTSAWTPWSYAEIEAELCLTEYQVGKLMKERLRALGVEKRIMKVEGAPTCHYRINWVMFEVQYAEFFEMETEVSLVSKPKKLGEPLYIRSKDLDLNPGDPADRGVTLAKLKPIPYVIASWGFKVQDDQVLPGRTVIRINTATADFCKQIGVERTDETAAQRLHEAYRWYTAPDAKGNRLSAPNTGATIATMWNTWIAEHTSTPAERPQPNPDCPICGGIGVVVIDYGGFNTRMPCTCIGGPR